MNINLIRQFLLWAERVGILLFLVGILYGWWFLRMRPPVEGRSLAVGVEAWPASVTDGVAVQVISQDVFQGLLAARDLFSPPEVEKNEAAEDSGDFSAQFQVVGIVLGADPQVIVEDRNTRKTIFVGSRQETSGMRIDRVEKGKIHLTYQGRSYGIDIKN
ncbi:MAG: hypothetical protein GX606_06735 [Elusimicrobia bacterium]|nr:hypothetical protein [Elusimicrobiota bacterium]